MVLNSEPMIKRSFTTLVVTFGMTSSCASTLSDSLPVCSIERLPTPLSSTSSKPLTSLDSLVTLAGSFVLGLGSSWRLDPAEEVTTEVDEFSPVLDLEDEELTEEMLPFLQVRCKLPPLMLCIEWAL